jgi:hypothetical protein
MAPLNPVKAKSQFLQGSNHFSAVYGWEARHLAHSNNILELGQLGGA